MLRELLQSAYRPQELSAMVKMKLSGFGNAGVTQSLDALAAHTDDLSFCYAALNKVSRSFAVVIRHLPEELRDAVCVFYLVLRGLDTVEDDTTVPQEKKLPLLRNFYAKNHEPDWHISGIGDTEDYRALLSHYGKVARSFQRLAPKYQSVILNICKKMGAGMADFSERPVVSVDDYDLYCHYVAGLVGIGLSELFAASGIENPVLREQPALSNAMGLFLQKTNIVRDYHEDLMSGRVFWPREIWSRHADKLEDFRDASDTPSSLACLNEMVSDAVQHAPDSLEYVSHLQHPDVFRFCAIPQVMALATLAKLYDNPTVFTGVVKIRKGLAARLMLEVTDYASFKSYFNLFATEIFNKLNKQENANEELLERLFDIFRKCNRQYAPALLEATRW